MMIVFNPYVAVCEVVLNYKVVNSLLILISLMIACCLFYYGITIPYVFRLRGDAWEYMSIAQQFSSWADAIQYTGARSIGFPLFNYLFLHYPFPNHLSTINAICASLFVIHELVVFSTCMCCVKLKLYSKQSIYFGLIFFVLASYPLIVMHTTTPLTDVLGMDLLLAGFSIFAWVNKESTHQWSWGFISGLLLSYAILVRPAYWIGIVSFLACFILISSINQRSQKTSQPILMWLITTLTLIVVIFSVGEHGKTRYQTFCLQAPNTFNSIASINYGLSSAKTVWTHAPGVSDFYPETFLVKYMHERCPVQSVMGPINTNNANLLSCLITAPHLTAIYVIKKTIGLFNPFRMTPYTETQTPQWYVWLARIYSCIAFIGLWIILWESIKGLYQMIFHRKTMSPFIVAICVFCIMQLLVQVILHVEERYALPWIPFCVIAFFLKIKDIQDKKNNQQLLMWSIIISLMVFGYFYQVLIWD